jgi:hypothetical protein
MAERRIAKPEGEANNNMELQALGLYSSESTERSPGENGSKFDKGPHREAGRRSQQQHGATGPRPLLLRGDRAFTWRKRQQVR